MICLDNPPTRINFLFFLSLSEHVSWHVVGWARKEETSKLFSFLLPCLIQILRWNHFLKPTKAIAAKVLSPIVIRSEISGHSNANAAPDAKFICGKIKQRSFGNNRPNGNCWNWLLSPPWGQLDPVDNCRDHQECKKYRILWQQHPDSHQGDKKTLPSLLSIVYPLFPPTSQNKDLQIEGKLYFRRNILKYVQYDEWFWKMYFFLDKYFEKCTSWWDLINIFPSCLAITQPPQAVGGPILSDYYLCFFSLCQKLISYIDIFP